MARKQETRLTTKGQIVIPKDTRARLGWRPGIRLRVDEEAGAVTLRPIKPDTFERWLAALAGSVGGGDPIAELEAEHREEIRKDEKRHAGLLGRPRVPSR
jgi:AbrB family looped-hinge helix DNA binding protein